MQNIKLYIGAHKTATTHIQQLLGDSRTALLNNDVALSIPNDLRKEWIPIFFKSIENNNQISNKEIRDLSPLNHTWIFSDENFSGSSFEFSQKPGLYNSLQTRLEKFVDIFSDSDIEVFFSIRSYETFYRSAYLEVIRNRGYIPFDRYYTQDQFNNNSWVNVIESIANVIPHKNITIWCYEDFNNSLPSIIKQLTNLPDVNTLITNYRATITRPSISNRSLKIISLLSKIIPSKNLLFLTDHLNTIFPANNNNGYFMPFSASEVHDFQKSYLNDIESIKTKYPKINFLERE